MRVKREYRTISRDNYDRFCAGNPKVNITYKKYKEIIHTCNKMFITKALDTGDPVKLPYGFGAICPTKYKQKNTKTDPNTGKVYMNLPVDWKKTREEGCIIYNMNFHTSGYRFKWRWFAENNRLYQSSVWVLKPCRWASRELAKYILSDTHFSQLYKKW